MRVPFVVLAVSVAALFAAAPARGAIVINEFDSQPSDWVELYNTGPGPVDIGNYVLRDSGNANAHTIAAPTVLNAGAYHVVDPTPFGLGNPDAVRLFDNVGTLIDSYAYADHARTTFGRCPTGTGTWWQTDGDTKGAANNCPAPATTWPGSQDLATASDFNFGDDLSGLAYMPSGSAAPGVLWATNNGTAKLYRLVPSGGKWTPDTANGWVNGKTLVFPNGLGLPDAEGVTLVPSDPSAVYVSIERDDSGGAPPSRLSVLRYDTSTAGATLTATNEWNLTADLPPAVDDNAGLEAVAWVPDEVLVAQGLRTSGGTEYDPAAYPGHGTGLFFVGVEETGEIGVFALNPAGDAHTKVTTFASGFPQIMDLEFEPETKRLWAVCDDNCNGRVKTFDIAQGGGSDGQFVEKTTYERPSGIPLMNNEGFAIAPQAECSAGFKPVFWADDSNTAGISVRSGTLNCTAPSAPPTQANPISPPVTTTTPTPLPVAPVLPAQPSRDIVRPKVTRLSVTRKSVTFTLDEAASVTVTVEKRSGRKYKKVKAFKVKGKRGKQTVKFKGRVSAARTRRGKLRISVVATDAAGNKSVVARKTIG